MNGFESALELLRPETRATFEMLSEQETDRINEIRLRIGRHISVSTAKENLFVDRRGFLSADSKYALPTESCDIEYAFKNAFSYSLHSYSKELSMGYITVGKGNRVGICGTASVSPDDYSSVDTVKYVSSINIRISREVKGFAEKLVSECIPLGSEPVGILIIGSPSGGKTTLLRDTARILGNRFRISLIDEQNELSATVRNSTQNDIGEFTDVFVGYPKHVGISTAVRVMSPKIIIADEIGASKDLEALEYALHSGVRLITAVHAESYDDAMRKYVVKSLVAENAFKHAVVLGDDFRYDVMKID